MRYKIDNLVQTISKMGGRCLPAGGLEKNIYTTGTNHEAFPSTNVTVSLTNEPYMGGHKKEKSYISRRKGSKQKKKQYLLSKGPLLLVGGTFLVRP